MAGRRRLRGGAPRLLGKHDGICGKWYREAWDAIVQELGVVTGLRRLEAGRVAVAWVRFRTATEALEEAKRLRRNGRGRRPSDRALERLSRRAGLEDAAWGQAIEKLRALVDDADSRVPDLRTYLSTRGMGVSTPENEAWSGRGAASKISSLRGGDA